MNNQLTPFLNLIAHELLLFKRSFLDQLIDVCMMFTTSILVFSYFMPINQASGYGAFILAGSIASFGFFKITGKVSILTADIDGDRTISYYLTLPMNSWLVFCAFAVSWAVESAVLSLALFPLGKLLLYQQFNLHLISVAHFIPIFILTNLFFGFFSIFLVSILKGMRSIPTMWIRILNPMWFFGCNFFPWSKAYCLSPIIGYAILVNPFVYIMEGTRAAMFGQAGYLPYALSVAALCGFIILAAFVGIKRLKKRLDYVG